MRVKILDAMARGLPIVSTTVGCEGIDVQTGKHLLVADQPNDFAAQVVRLLTDRPLAQSIACAGRDLVLHAYDTSAIGSSINTALESLPKGPSSGQPLTEES
jgi:glycosyltransferase involved in cell wall biosynthesis